METFLFNIRCYYFPQYKDQRLNHQTLIFEVADYTHNFPKMIQDLLTTSVSRDQYASYLSELSEYYDVFDHWVATGSDQQLEQELVEHVLTNRKEHTKKLGF